MYYATLNIMRNILLVIVGLVLGTILLINLLPDAVDELVTEGYAENFNVSTGVGVTNTTETLSYSHYYEDLTELSATSDNEDDTPAILDYDEDSYDVTVGGLHANDSRILTISYVREANQEFSGFSGFVRLLPFLGVVGLWVGGLWGLFSHGRNRG